MSTIERSAEVERFLRSLTLQTYRDFELIVVDENEDDRLDSILAAFKSQFAIRHIRPSRKGLSCGRNVGLPQAHGDIVAFPDDDCWYPEKLLTVVNEFLEEHPEYDGLTGRCLDENGVCSMGRWDNDCGLVDFMNVWCRVTSFALFVRAKAITGTYFDETLGIGAGTPWGSSEEIDYVVRLIKQKAQLYYNPNLVVHHPVVVREFDDNACARHFSYGRGMGRVLRLHGYPLKFSLWALIRPLAGGLLAVCSGNLGKARYHFKGFWGRLSGWCSRVR